MPVRTVVTRSGKRFRGYFPSRKLRRMVGWESILERDAIAVLEYLPTVLHYEEQPSEETYYLEDGTTRRTALRRTRSAARGLDGKGNPRGTPLQQRQGDAPRPRSGGALRAG